MLDIILYIAPWLPIFYMGIRWERYRTKTRRRALKGRVTEAKRLARNQSAA